MISAIDFESALHLDCLIPSSREEWDIRTPDLNRPGMQFCGFYEFFAFERPQLIGKAEMAYLDRQTPEKRIEILEKYFSYPIPCVIICRSLVPPQELLSSARNHDIPTLREGSSDAEIVMTKSEIEKMASSIQDYADIEYIRNFQAPIEAGETIAKMTYHANGNSYVYDLKASRSVEQRENIPKSLEEIISETYADPNPFPPFNMELALILFGPPLLIAALVFLLVRYRKKKGARQMRAPRPVNRYVK